jgi:L-lactate dehydrogenase complex protein LldG
MPGSGGMPGGPERSARDEVLARIAAATSRPSPAVTDRADRAEAGQGAEAGQAGYRQAGLQPGPELLDLLADRLADYRAIVRRATAASLAQEISAALSGRAGRRLVVPPELGLPLPGWAEVTVDSGLSAAELDDFDGVVTGAAVAIAETGTIVLAGGPGQGRRAISLVPDYHLCVVGADQVVHLVPEAIARLSALAGQPLTWISGPSATSDIELDRIEGVHGPRTLEVILVTG